MYSGMLKIWFTIFVSCVTGRGRAVLRMSVAEITRVIQCGDTLHSPQSSEDVSAGVRYNGIYVSATTI